MPQIKFRNFFRIIQLEQSTTDDKEKEITDKVDDVSLRVSGLFDAAIKERDREKMEIILGSGFNMNYNQFMALCEKEKASYSSLKSEVVTRALEHKYMNEVRFDIDQKLQSINFSSNDPKLSEFSKNTIMVWDLFDKKKEFTDANYCFEFRKIATKVREQLPSLNVKAGFNHACANLGFELKKLIKHIDLQNIDICSMNGALINTNRASELKSLKDMLGSPVDLPSHAQNIVREISGVASEISLLKLQTKEQLDFDNVYKKRLPQVIKEYSNISPLYREKLKELADSPDNVLLESLFEIKNKLTEIFDGVQNNHVHQQKITRQYLKSI